MRHHLATFIVSGAVALQAGVAWAQAAAATRLATLNARWLLNKAGFDHWRTACKVGMELRQLTCDQTKTLKALPYGKMHNGLTWPPEVEGPTPTKFEVLQLRLRRISELWN